MTKELKSRFLDQKHFRNLKTIYFRFFIKKLIFAGKINKKEIFKDIY